MDSNFFCEERQDKHYLLFFYMATFLCEID